MTSSCKSLVESFEAHDLDSGKFHHAEHVGVAYEMLRKYEFLKATVKYAENIKIIATKAGAANKFNVTITLAFMSLIAERMGAGQYRSYDEFIAQNRDLLTSDVLAKWYSSQRLTCDLARDVFLMPDR